MKEGYWELDSMSFVRSREHLYKHGLVGFRPSQQIASEEVYFSTLEEGLEALRPYSILVAESYSGNTCVFTHPVKQGFFRSFRCRQAKIESLSVHYNICPWQYSIDYTSNMGQRLIRAVGGDGILHQAHASGPSADCEIPGYLDKLSEGYLLNTAELASFFAIFKQPLPGCKEFNRNFKHVWLWRFPIDDAGISNIGCARSLDLPVRLPDWQSLVSNSNIPLKNSGSIILLQQLYREVYQFISYKYLQQLNDAVEVLFCIPDAIRYLHNERSISIILPDDLEAPEGFKNICIQEGAVSTCLRLKVLGLGNDNNFYVTYQFEDFPNNKSPTFEVEEKELWKSVHKVLLRDKFT